MAAQPICIITSTGMRCLASPIKHHRPGDDECGAVADNVDRDAKVKEIERFLGGRRTKLPGPKLPKPKREVVAKVIALLLAANVGGTTPFVVVRASKAQAPRRK